MKNPLVVIVGPTASGKTALSIKVAQKYNGEIICADSRTVYKDMDIGTAKPDKTDIESVSHHLLDVVEPSTKFNALMFKELANSAIKAIEQQNHLPIMVGGSGLYIDSILFDHQFGAPADESEREHLNSLTITQLVQMCNEQDIPLPANEQNKRHLIRAIELGGLPVKDYSKMRSDTLVVGIAIDRELLRQRIAERAEIMFSSGVIEETKHLADTYGWDSEAMTGSIYRIVKRLIDGDLTIDQAKEEFIRSDMRLAKRQMTWFKRNPHIIWGTEHQILQAIDHFLASK